jgi:hypothetical protein
MHQNTSTLYAKGHAHADIADAGKHCCAVLLLIAHRLYARCMAGMSTTINSDEISHLSKWTFSVLPLLQPEFCKVRLCGSPEMDSAGPEESSCSTNLQRP